MSETKRPSQTNCGRDFDHSETGRTRSFAEPLSHDERHICEPPTGERNEVQWWEDPVAPWWTCMFCGQRQMKARASTPSDKGSS